MMILLCLLVASVFTNAWFAFGAKELTRVIRSWKRITDSLFFLVNCIEGNGVRFALGDVRFRAEVVAQNTEEVGDEDWVKVPRWAMDDLNCALKNFNQKRVEAEEGGK